MEKIALLSAREFDEFYQAQRRQRRQEEKTGNILVITVDSKGVVMPREDLRENTKKRAAGKKKLDKRLTKGEKRNSKRMATVAAVYTIEPFKRTAEQIMKPEEYEKPQRPKPESKRVWANLTKEPEAIIKEAFDQGLYRDSNKQKTLLALVDGNKTQLRLLKELSQQYKKDVTIILDLILGN